jgi:hypothetical protein
LYRLRVRTNRVDTIVEVSELKGKQLRFRILERILGIVDLVIYYVIINIKLFQKFSFFLFIYYACHYFIEKQFLLNIQKKA